MTMDPGLRELLAGNADDDVAVDFAKEKKAAREAARPKTIDLTLPGWGSWGGDGLTVSKRKRKRFTVRAKPEAPRKDANKGNLILNETKSEALRSHQPDPLARMHIKRHTVKHRLGVELPTDAPTSQQERAYTSPIWYSPK